MLEPMESSIKRAFNEGTSLIIEGVNIIPGMISEKHISKKIILYVENEGFHRNMVLGKTHSKRRISDIDVDKMGAIAAKSAIGNNPPPDLIINASGVPKQTIPDTSVFFQKELGLNNIPCFSIHGTCLSFLIALKNASALIESKTYNKILIISADRGTMGRNPNEPESAALLGDGAAAVLIEPRDKINIFIKQIKID